MSFPIFSQNGFTIGIGDSNRDGKLDFDFGLRHDAFGSSPFGFGHGGAEIGFNTQRGLYAGADSSYSNMFGSGGSGGRIYSDGGVAGYNYNNDVFGNYNSSHINTGPFHYDSGANGGNVFSGNYWGTHTSANPWEMSNSNWGGNTWTGAHGANHNYSNVFGGGYSTSYATPPFVPSFGHGHYMGAGGYSVSAFMGF